MTARARTVPPDALPHIKRAVCDETWAKSWLIKSIALRAAVESGQHVDCDTRRKDGKAIGIPAVTHLVTEPLGEGLKG
jgi:hypothetical protein